MLEPSAFQNTLASLGDAFSSTVTNFDFSNILSDGFTQKLNQAINSFSGSNADIDALIEQVKTNAGISDAAVQRGSAQTDILLGTDIDNTLYGLAGEDYLLGGGGSDLLNGGTGTDWLLGDRGQDTLIDSDGGDYMLGGADSDVFRIYDWDRPTQASTLLDFEVGTDTIKIGRLGLTYDSFKFRDSTLGTSIYERGREIARLVGIAKDDLSADSFVFGDAAAADVQQTELEATVTERDLPGATKAIVTEDGFTWKGASGVSDLKSDRKMRADDVFSIASTTKAFTGATILKLVEAGTLTLEDTLGQWLPEIAKQYPGGEQFTIRDLLNGQSGIPSFDTSPGYSAELAKQTSLRDLRQFTRKLTPEKNIAFSYGVPLFTDGADPTRARASEKWAYTNTSDILAGLIAEKITGKSFAQLTRENVIEPLGLQNTSYAGEEEITGKLARSYIDLPGGADGVLKEGEPLLDNRPEDVTRTDVNLISSFGPAAAIFSNAEDTARFTQALFSGELLSEESLKEFTDTRPTGVAGFDAYGLGVIESEFSGDGRRSFLLGGDSLGYRSRTNYFPEQNGAIETVIVNRQFPFEALIANTPEPIDNPETPETAELPESEPTLGSMLAQAVGNLSFSG